jgi:hypothetical protein
MTQQPSTAPAQHVVQLDHWRCPIFGERWSLLRSDGKAVITCGTEAEALDAARELGWRVRGEGVGL